MKSIALSTLMPRIVLTTLGLFASALLFSSLAMAQPKSTGDRKQELDFEDSMIEGVNKRPLDSLSQISERNRRRRQTHLYWKKTNFKLETEETLRELRYFQ